MHKNKLIIKILRLGVEKMEKIKVLHIVSCLDVSSGVMSFIMNYYRKINREKVQFDFIYFLDNQKKTYKDEITHLGGSCYFLPKPSIRSYGIYKEFFKKNSSRYKVVHLHEVYLNSIILPLAKKYGIKHLISHAHATKFSDIKLRAIRNKILCLPIKRQANMYFACSKAAALKLYGNKYVNSGKVKVINNAIDVEKFKFNNEVRKEIRASLNIDDKFVIGHVGRFNKQKNHTFIIDIFTEVKKRKADSVLMLIGDGPLLEYIVKKVSLLGLEDSVLFLGRKSNVQDFLNAMDLFLLPSLFEGLPIAGVEAQASGLPIIMSTDITEEIGIANYSYVKLSEPAEFWAKKILDFKCNYERSKSYMEVMKAGFDICKEAIKLEEIYCDLT